MLRPTHLTFLLLIGASIAALCQRPGATIRVEVRSETGPIAGAKVTLKENSVETDSNGIAVIPTELGTVEVHVTKEGFFAGTAVLSVDDAREWSLVVELQPEQKVEEQITVHATRT